MVLEITILSLLAFTFLREWQNAKIQRELLNKLMSRNYYDYKIAEAVIPFKEQQEVIDPEFKPVTDPLLNQQLDSLTGLV